MVLKRFYIEAIALINSGVGSLMSLNSLSTTRKCSSKASLIA